MSTPLIEWAAATAVLPGQTQSGDRFVVKPYPNGVLVAAVDGLGHGREAAAAAALAVATLEGFAPEGVIALVRRCHEKLRASRGVVMSLATFYAPDGTMTWLGVGNVEGKLLRADSNVRPQSEYLLLRGGVVGGQLPPLHASVIPVLRGDTLIFATDGIRVPFLEDADPNGPPQRIAERILGQKGKGTDDALVLVARYLGGAP